ncbi:hypothetical protein [Rickettsia endosymbiont of Orchestes rusci]
MYGYQNRHCEHCCMARIFDVIPAQAEIQKNYSHPEFISGYL